MCKLLAEFSLDPYTPSTKSMTILILQGLNDGNKYVYALVNRIEKVS